MENLKLSLQFTNTAEEEIHKLVGDIKLINLVESVRNYRDELPQDVLEGIGNMLEFFSDMFSTGLPDIYTDPQKTLQAISRDINISRLLRERGLFRLYKFVTTNVNVDVTTGKQTDTVSEYTAAVPMYLVMENPDTGGRFTSQEDFIGWFCRESHVSRSLVFMRIATISKVLSLGLTLDQSFELITKKPSIIRETLNLIGVWENGELVSMNPDVALHIAEHTSGDAKMDADNIRAMIEDTDGSAVGGMLADVMKPAIVNLLEQVAQHDRSQGALEYIKHDVFGEPEITYKWDIELDALVIEYVHKAIDENGREHIEDIKRVVLVPDSANLLPHAVRNDLLKRLPIKNRSSIDKY